MYISLSIIPVQPTMVMIQQQYLLAEDIENIQSSLCNREPGMNTATNWAHV